MAIKIPQINIPGIPAFKKRDAYAIDIGSSSIKILYLKQSGSSYSLLKWGHIPLNDAGTELSPQDRKNIAVTRIAEFIAREKLPTKNVISSVSGNQVIVRYVKFPKLSREELNKTIQFEAEPYIPFDIREVDLSFHILGDIVEDGQKKMDTILVAAKKEVIQSRLEILNDLNLRPVVIDLDVFALQNAFEINNPVASEDIVLMINIGASVTNMAIIEKQVSRVVRDVFISGNSFTKAIQRNLSCDMKTAEEMKAKFSILVTAEEKEKTLSENQKEALQVSSALTPVAKELLGEIQRSIDFFVSQNPEKTIQRIMLSGGSASLKNLDNYINNALKVPVEIFNPLKSIAGGEAIPENLAATFAVAAGLATRRESDMPKK